MGAAYGLSGLGAATIGGLIVALNVALVLGMMVLSYKHARQGVQKMWIRNSAAWAERTRGSLAWLQSIIASRRSVAQDRIQVN